MFGLGRARARKPPVVARGEVTLGDAPVRYTACAVDGLRQAAWVAYADRVHVRLPRGLTRSRRRLGEIAASLLQHDVAAVRRAMAQAGQVDLARATAAQQGLGEHTFLLRGRPIRLEAEEHPGARYSIVEHMPPLLRIVLPPGQLGLAEEIALGWLREQAAADLTERLRVRGAEMGLQHGRVTVRDQSSRWGSCSSTTNLAFSWRLVMAPPDVLDYVVVHELAHLAQMNHSPAFWALVEQHCPNWKRWRRWLRVYHREMRVPLLAARPSSMG